MVASVDERSAFKLSLAVTLLRSVGEARLAVSGASMLPCLWPGDILQVTAVEANQVSPGDVVVFGRNDRLIVHRVLQVNQSGDGISLLTRGDRLSRLDSPVSASELLGRVTEVQRGAKIVDPRLSKGTQLTAWVLRRSEFCTRALLRAKIVWQRTWWRNQTGSTATSPETAWAN